MGKYREDTRKKVIASRLTIIGDKAFYDLPNYKGTCIFDAEDLWVLDLHLLSSDGMKGVFATIDNTRIRLCRLVMNCPDDKEIDHKDKNPLNNCKSNLRFTERTGNNRNRVGWKRKTGSKYKGVFYRKDTGKFRASIGVDHKKINLGQFDNEEDAARAYNEAAIKYHGEFAFLN
jgi:hypothetical protein